MPQFEVTVVERIERTYVITVRAKDEDTAGDKALALYSRAKESGKPLPWEEEIPEEDIEVSSIEEI